MAHACSTPPAHRGTRNNCGRCFAPPWSSPLEAIALINVHCTHYHHYVCICSVMSWSRYCYILRLAKYLPSQQSVLGGITSHAVSFNAQEQYPSRQCIAMRCGIEPTSSTTGRNAIRDGIGPDWKGDSRRHRGGEKRIRRGLPHGYGR
jgi:hypothetical protein